MGDTVRTLWSQRSSGALPMPPHVKLSGFCRWIRRKCEQVATVEDLEGLDLPLAMAGGRVRFPGHPIRVVYASWRVVGEHRNLRRGEIFGGQGSSVFEASLTALMTAYEMIVLRRGRPLRKTES